MFGADTPLVMDAIQIGVLAVVAGAGGFWLIGRLRRRHSIMPSEPKAVSATVGSLEDRVRVLERIATDRSVDLADEIDALRNQPTKKGAS